MVYIHGYTDSERQRLSSMQAILNHRKMQTMDLNGIQTVLDVGCGLGQFTRLIARQLDPRNQIQVVGIEKDCSQLDRAMELAEVDDESQLVDFRIGDADSLPLSENEWGSFDLAHTRFLLEHVRNPGDVVAQMVQAVKPGGRIYLIDDDHDLLKFSPDCPAIADLWRRYSESYRWIDRDPIVGRRLPQLLTACGARCEHVDTLFYGGCRGQDLFDLIVENIIGVIQSSAGLLIDQGGIDRSGMDDAFDALRLWKSIPGATVWYSLPYAIGRRTQ